MKYEGCQRIEWQTFGLELKWKKQLISQMSTFDLGYGEKNAAFDTRMINIGLIYTDGNDFLSRDKDS